METSFYEEYRELQRRHWWFLGRRRIVERILDTYGPPPGLLPVLDFGCGPGTFLPSLAKHGPVHGVDGDPEAVRICQRDGFADVSHVPATAPLAFEDGTFGLAVALDVIEHIEDDLQALRELRRVMRRGGTLLVTVPAFPLLWGDQDEISHHFRRYRRRQLLDRLRAAGFDPVVSSYFNTALFPAVAAVRLGRRVLRPPTAEHSDFEVGPAWINRPLTKLFASEAPLATHGVLPFGVSLLAVSRAA